MKSIKLHIGGIYIRQVEHFFRATYQNFKVVQVIRNDIDPKVKTKA